MPSIGFFGRAGLRPRRRLLVLALLLCSALAVVPSGAQAATLNATTSNLSSVFSSAQPGDTILLATGSYGSWAGGTKSGMVTLRPASGATVSMSPQFTNVAYITLDGMTLNGVYAGGSTHDVTFSNSKVTAPSVVDASTMKGNDILFDRDTFDNIDACGTCYEGRLTIRGNNNTAPVGVKITNSHFGNSGGSDGVQVVGDAYGVEIGPGNEFSGIRQGNYAAHVDSIQLYGSKYTQIVGNYFHDDDTIIMAPDGGDHEYIANNVMIGGGYLPAVQLGSHVGTQFVHNTVKNISVHADAKSGETPSKSVVVSNNVFAQGADTNALDGGMCTGCTVSYNLFATSGDASGTNTTIGTPTFAGGTSPTTWAGYALAAGSPGKATASDGTDRGIDTDGVTVDPPPPADTTAPDTTIGSGPSGTITTNSGSFAFTATESGATFACKLDAGSWAACTSPKAYTSLADGSHTFSVRATDAAGNTDATPATRTFTVSTATTPPADTTAPDTTITSGPSGLTGDAAPAFGFTATEAGSTFQCRVDSGTWKTCTSPYTLPAQADGDHAFSVRATDAAGNRDASPAARSFTVDTKAPETTITAAPLALSVGDSATLSFTSDDPAATFACRLDGGAWTPCASPATFSGLTLQSHTVEVRAVDAAGNVDTSPDSASWLSVVLPGTDTTTTTPVDTTTTTPTDTTTTPVTDPVSSVPPPAPVTDPAAPTLALLKPTSGSTFTSTLTAAASAADADGVKRVEFWLDGKRIASDTRAPYATSYSVPRTLAYGTHTLSVRAFDTLGAASSVAIPLTRVRTSARTAKKSARGAAWRLTSSASGTTTELQGAATANDTMTIAYTSCSDGRGRESGRQKVRADSAGHIAGTLPVKGACVLKVS